MLNFRCLVEGPLFRAIDTRRLFAFRLHLGPARHRSCSMSAIGRFLEIIVPVDDIRESLAFYLDLGFTELDVGDIRPHYYAVVSDGRIAIGLHGGLFNETALSFVQPDLAAHARRLGDAGSEFEFRRTGPDEFNEIGLRSPDGHLLVISEASTYPQAQIERVRAPAIGQVSEFALRSEALGASTAFWTRAGCIVDPDSGENEVVLYATGLRLRLTPDVRAREPVLRYRVPDIDAALDELARKNIRPRQDESGYLVTTPDGLRLSFSAT